MCDMKAYAFVNNYINMTHKVCNLYTITVEPTYIIYHTSYVNIYTTYVYNYVHYIYAQTSKLFSNKNDQPL